MLYLQFLIISTFDVSRPTLESSIKCTFWLAALPLLNMLLFVLGIYNRSS